MTSYTDYSTLNIRLIHYTVFYYQSPQSILGGTVTYEQFIRDFLEKMFPLGDVPLWTVEALQCAGFTVKTTVSKGTGTKPGIGIDSGTEIELEIATGIETGIETSSDR